MLKEVVRFVGLRVAEAQTVATDPNGARCAVINRIKDAYAANRAPELIGTSPYSGTFIGQWLEEGLIPRRAWNGLVNRERGLGVWFLPAQVKAAITLSGSALLSTGLTQATQEGDSKIREALYRLTVGILFWSEGSATQTPTDAKDAARRAVEAVKNVVISGTEDLPGGQTPSGRR